MTQLSESKMRKLMSVRIVESSDIGKTVLKAANGLEYRSKFGAVKRKDVGKKLYCINQCARLESEENFTYRVWGL